MTRTSHRAGATASALSAALLLAACSSSSNNSPGASGGSASAADSRDATITITADKGCTLDRTTFNAGALNVKVNNVDAAAVSEVEVRATGERILGEVENVPPSISGTFSLDLAAGQYTMYCPGAKTERSTFTVSGTAPSAGDTDVHVLLDSGTKTYGQYVTNEVGNLVSSVTALNKALAGTDLTAAQAAYIKARPYYERIEPVAESFKDPKDLDAAIDERPADGQTAQQITGFHRIEYGLFTAKSLAGLAPIGNQLLADCTALQKLTKDLAYKPAELANGAADLLSEAGTSKITGEEEHYSHIDVLDFQANVEGSQQAFANIQPGLAKVDSTLTSTIGEQFDALNTVLDGYRTDGNPSGFVLYPDLTAADKTKLTASLTALSANVSKVGKLIVGQ